MGCLQFRFMIASDSAIEFPRESQLSDFPGETYEVGAGVSLKELQTINGEIRITVSADLSKSVSPQLSKPVDPAFRESVFDQRRKY